jgi:hypothetical protein
MEGSRMSHEMESGCPTFAAYLYLPLRWDIYNYSSLHITIVLNSYLFR